MDTFATQRSAYALITVLSWQELAAAEPTVAPAAASAVPTNSAAAPAGAVPAASAAPANPAPASNGAASATPAVAGVAAVPAPPQAPIAASPPAPTPSRPPPPASPAPPHERTRAAPNEARVHLAANYEGAWLEGRSRIDEGGWQRLCAAPCDRFVAVEGLDMRVTAPRMTASNPFAIEPGGGTARLRVSGGSASARDIGIIGLAAGLPVTFAGVTLLGVGSIRDEPGERTAGIVTLAIGAVAVLAALPLLVMGSTSVKNAEGRNVASTGQRRF